VRCSGCGARPAADAVACSFCGTPTGFLAPQPEPPPRDPDEERRARMRELGRSPQFEVLAGRSPSTAGVIGGFVVLTLFGTAFAAVSCFIASRAPRHGLFGVMPVLFTLIGIGIGVTGIAKWIAFANAPLRVFPSYVVAKRTHVTGGKNSSTSYFVTLESERGARTEHKATGSAYGLVREGELGVAYVQGGHLLEFRAA
jgi:hypothetical protein